MIYQVLCGDVLEMMRTLPDESVNCVVTSPPYYGLRDYGHERQLGLEQTPAEYIEKMVEVFCEVRRVLRGDGTLWLNLGDSYCNSNGFARASAQYQRQGRNDAPANDRKLRDLNEAGYKTKDLIGIPWRVALALQADGWYLRQDIIWHKPNPMPESVRDRCTRAHEYVFMLTKSPKYWYDADAIKEDAAVTSSVKGGPNPGFHVKHCPNNSQPSKKQDTLGKPTYTGFNKRYKTSGGVEKKNCRSVWNISPRPYKGAHFAVFPPELPRRCVLAGCPEGGVVLDPFAGSGTTLEVALRHGRNAIGIELNPDYCSLINERMQGLSPSLFCGEVE